MKKINHCNSNYEVTLIQISGGAISNEWAVGLGSVDKIFDEQRIEKKIKKMVA